MSSYCEIAQKDPLHKAYHDTEYGFPARDESVLFERLVMEIMQAGLSWDLILKKRPAFQKAFAQFSVDKIACFGPEKVEALLTDAAIIRNRRKIEAVIENARIVQQIRKEQGSFAAWLDGHAGKKKAEWVKIFKKTFRFMGPEVVGEFLMSLGYLEGAHSPVCPISKKIKVAKKAFRAQK